MGARIAMTRLAKDEPGFVLLGLGFTIGPMSGERQVPATTGRYGTARTDCQRHGRGAIIAGDGAIRQMRWAGRAMEAMPFGLGMDAGLRPDDVVVGEVS